MAKSQPFIFFLLFPESEFLDVVVEASPVTGLAGNYGWEGGLEIRNHT